MTADECANRMLDLLTAGRFLLADNPEVLRLLRALLFAESERAAAMAEQIANTCEDAHESTATLFRNYAAQLRRTSPGHPLCRDDAKGGPTRCDVCDGRGVVRCGECQHWLDCLRCAGDGAILAASPDKVGA